MSPGSNTESYPAFAHIGLRENPRKNLNQIPFVLLCNFAAKKRRTAGYTLLDRKRNEEILEQLEVESVEEKISRYKFNWLDHVRRMENSRIPKIMMQYKSRGHRRPGRSLRRLLDGTETVDYVNICRTWSQTTKEKTLEERDSIRCCGLNFGVAQWLEHLYSTTSAVLLQTYRAIGYGSKRREFDTTGSITSINWMINSLFLEEVEDVRTIRVLKQN
ncbi:hypothetical protein ANN_24970 [Periplaneta americana]|uniref:Uncharacterized protein n=1 Tax=Periplaneta americana TaxID=6978 RepID=A0ABQ8S0N3_PERAM|nr:hypothetical protein ANN_24970 [Periplaneta americana]